MDAGEVSRFTERLSAPTSRVHFFPIRHHSPACAFQLARALREIRPRLILIEAPADFSHLIPLLVDPELRPPVAIVAMPWERGPDGPAAVAYWPLSATAPEYAAMRAAKECGAAVQFFDLPSFKRKVFLDEADLAEPALQREAPIVLTDDRQLDHSSYCRALTQRAGCRDFNELSDRLFEAKIADPDWRGFFAAIGAYCLLARRAYADEALAADGTLARELYMAARLASALATTDGIVAVVAGGLHVSALIDRPENVGAPDAPDSASRAYLVRFSHQRLDALNGYAAGMPSPRYYERLLAAAERGEPDPHRACAEEIVLDLVARLRLERPGFAPSAPMIVEALRHAAALAALRGLPGPLRSELCDGARAALVKDEDIRFASPVMQDLAALLTGSGIGDVPFGAGAPPLVEAARREARALGFSVGDSVARRRELDIHRKGRHAEASRFLHAMTLIGAEFARLEQGADYAVGVDLDRLFEIWIYAWSPLVEARLIEAAADGDDVAQACASSLRRRAAQLALEGRARNAAEAANLLFAAARAGVAPALLRELLQMLESEISEDSDLVRISIALRNLFLLWRARPVLNLTRERRLGGIIGACYRRAVFLAPTIATTKPEQMAQTAQALVAMRDVLNAVDDLPQIDPDLFVEAVDDLLAGQLPPLLHGVVAALAVQFGRRSAAFLASQIAGALGGAAIEPEDRVAPLAGLLMVSPAALGRIEEVATAVDHAIDKLEEAEFVRMLPHLRSAFTVLSPAEAEALGATIASRHGLTPDAFDIRRSVAIGEAELRQNLALALDFERLWREDGLGAWLPAGDRR